MRLSLILTQRARGGSLRFNYQWNTCLCYLQTADTSGGSINSSFLTFLWNIQGWGGGGGAGRGVGDVWKRGEKRQLSIALMYLLRSASLTSSSSNFCLSDSFTPPKKKKKKPTTTTTHLLSPVAIQNSFQIIISTSLNSVTNLTHKNKTSYSDFGILVYNTMEQKFCRVWHY